MREKKVKKTCYRFHKNNFLITDIPTDFSDQRNEKLKTIEFKAILLISLLSLLSIGNN